MDTRIDIGTGKARPRSSRPRFALVGQRADGTGRMILSESNDRARLEEVAARRSNARTRFFVEENR